MLTDPSADPDEVFRRALDSELRKICSFYEAKEAEVYDELDALQHDHEAFLADREADGNGSEHTDGMQSSRSMSVFGPGPRHRSGSIFKSFGFNRRRRSSFRSGSMDEDGDDSDDDDADETVALNGSRQTRSRSSTWEGNTNQSIDGLRASRELPSKRRGSQAFDDYNDHVFSALYEAGITLKKRTISLYVSLNELRSYIQLNKTGFTKALKKFDKTLDRNLKPAYVENSVEPAYPFRRETMQRLGENVARLEQAYADVVTKGDLSEAKRELRLHLREHVVWERNTVWREMIGIERKAQAANMGLRRTLLGGDEDPAKARRQGDEPDDLGTKEVMTPIGRLHCPKILLSSNFFTLLGILVVFVVLLRLPLLEKAEQRNCLAMLVLVSLLWATEVSRSCLVGIFAHGLAGHSPFCDIIANPFPGRRASSRAGRRQTSPSIRFQSSSDIHLCCHVDTGHHATSRGLRNCCRFIQV